MRTPDFLIVGAHRCGTTSLYRTLATHPQVWLPATKEPHYLVAEEAARWRFANGTSPMPDLVTAWSDYTSLFEDAPTRSVTCDASVLYLPLHQIAIPAIRRRLGPDVRIVISLRDPSERAYSAYLYNRESYPDERAPSFAAALDRLDRGDRVFAPTMDYLNLSRYAEAVAAYTESFDHVHVLRFEDLMADGAAALDDLYRFLGLDPSVTNLAAVNGSGWQWNDGLARQLVNSRLAVAGRRKLKSRAPGAHRWLHRQARRRLASPAPALDEADRRRCIDRLSEDIAATEALLGWDLASWRSPSADLVTR